MLQNSFTPAKGSKSSPDESMNTVDIEVENELLQQRLHQLREAAETAAEATETGQDSLFLNETLRAEQRRLVEEAEQRERAKRKAKRQQTEDKKKEFKARMQRQDAERREAERHLEPDQLQQEAEHGGAAAASFDEQANVAPVHDQSPDVADGSVQTILDQPEVHALYNQPAEVQAMIDHQDNVQPDQSQPVDQAVPVQQADQAIQGDHQMGLPVIPEGWAILNRDIVAKAQHKQLDEASRLQLIKAVENLELRLSLQSSHRRTQAYKQYVSAQKEGLISYSQPEHCSEEQRRKNSIRQKSSRADQFDQSRRGKEDFQGANEGLDEIPSKPDVPEVLIPEDSGADEERSFDAQGHGGGFRGAPRGRPRGAPRGRGAAAVGDRGRGRPRGARGHHDQGVDEKNILPPGSRRSRYSRDATEF